MEYLLAPDVHLCTTDDCVVLLDLASDRYLALEPAKANQLVEFVECWPRMEIGNEGKACKTDAPRRLISRLSASGLLTAHPNLGRPATPVSVAYAETALVEPDLDQPPSTKIADYLDLALACSRAALLLRFWSLARVVKRVARRRAQQPGAQDATRELRRLAAAFLHLRPLFFTTRRHCLLDSLTLLEFLALHGIFPAWVFGVQTGPFAAHCWVQSGVTICNDTPENVRRFKPILMV